MALFKFKIDNVDSNARAGTINFENGVNLETPLFMPVGTQANVKSLSSNDLDEIGYKMILTNTYHLYLRPGTDLLKTFGGVKKFMAWPYSMLTDSGGFQAFSLSTLTKYSDSGIKFKSHLDGSYHDFTPENVLDFQASIGSDIVMPLDDCAPYPASEKRIIESLARTHAWLERSRNHWIKNEFNKTQSLFGIIQGGTGFNTRKQSAQAVTSLELPGYAIGGLSVGEKNREFEEALAATTEEMPSDKPRYLMGVGSIPEILYSVSKGIDMFDCVLPTRNARNGQVFTSLGKVNVRAEYNKLKDTPMDERCTCKVCKSYSLGYIRHLHKTKELLAYSLTTYHNLFFMKKFMEQLRESIIQNNFQVFYNEWYVKFK